MMAATPLLAAILMANASLTIAFISQQSRHEHPSLWYQTNPLITHHFHLSASTSDEDDGPIISQTQNLKELASQIDIDSKTTRPRYELGVGKNMPITRDTAVQPKNGDVDLQSLNAMFPSQQDVPSNAASNWNVAEPAKKKPKRQKYDMGMGKHSPLSVSQSSQNNEGDSYGYGTTRRLLPKGDEESARLTKAVWDRDHFKEDSATDSSRVDSSDSIRYATNGREDTIPDSQQQTISDYKEIDLSIPQSVYSLGSSSSSNSSEPVDLVWDLMRQEAYREASREPLLVSFLYSTILNHPTLESALAFHLANRLSSPAMLSTQIMSLIREALDSDLDFRRNLRADMLAVRDRDPACNCLPDVFLYFKGFHALQTYRVSNYLWKSGRRVLAHYLQSQVSQNFQIDIHPNATLGSGIMLDHGTGIVIGETAHLGHNCSVLHHVTLGGSGKQGVDRHPKVGNGVLLGAGSSVLGNIKIGDGCQVGAGTLVIEDLPERSVAVGVPAKIIGRFVDVTAQPSIGMNQLLGSKEAENDIVMFGMDGI